MALVERSCFGAGKGRVRGVGGGDEGRHLGLVRGLEEVEALQLAPSGGAHIRREEFMKRRREKKTCFG